MAQNKTLKIAFPNGGIIPSDQLKGDADKSVPPHEAISVPYAYGKHLCDDKFAYEVKGKPSNKKAKSEPTQEELLAAERETKAAELNERYDSAVAKLESASGDADIVSAQAAVDLIKTEIADFASGK